MADLKKRIEVQKKSRELGRCVCSTPAFPFPCPCPWFIKTKGKECKCAGETISVTQQEWAKYNVDNNKK